MMNYSIKTEIARIVEHHIPEHHPHVRRHLGQDLMHLAHMIEQDRTLTINASWRCKAWWKRLWLSLWGDL